ncbi:hypothetical protein ABL78_0869 [Leptomonas seymouri]|uniref:Uncharacterized protein n=1 Tax=Leptomonas seymouri TaxID=5684 RepID=A0A0N0P8J3_LEPSE|nr:hypothetical protein ABL78_0869 [Leptomonas seymouri]|eukprot:KPI90009.1 hypothetical protein ABL78_0869 [Leptomonas seymouri]
MSGYADVRDAYRLHSNRVSGDGHRSSEGMHADAYQAVAELTERLEAESEAAAHTRSSRRGQRKEDSQPFLSSLLTPPLPSSPTWNAADVIALYMRRQRYAIQMRKMEDEEVTVAAAAAPTVGASMAHHSSASSHRIHDGRHLESYSLKLLLLGDDAAVQELAATLRAGAEEVKVTPLSDSKSNAAARHPQGQQALFLSATALPLPEVYTMPRAIEGLTALRAELCRWCDVVLLCYHVADPASVVHLRDEVVPATLAACSREGEAPEWEAPDGAIRRCPSKLDSTNTTALLQSSVWPAMAPPFILVGLGAEARLNRPIDQRAPWITSADVLGFAAEVGLQRVVELNSHNPRHVHILLLHCRTLRGLGYQGFPSPAAQGRRAALKELGLHVLLRTPPPMLELHPGSRTVHVALPPRIPTSAAARFPANKTGNAASSRATAKENGEGVQCYYAVSDAADMDTAPVTPSYPVPVNGVLSYADIYDAYRQSTGRPAQHAAAILLTVCTAVPYLFPSELVQQRIPTPAAPPSGYVDVVHRCCRLTIPSPSLHSASHEQRGGGRSGGASRVRFTLGDTTTSFDAPPLELHDRRSGSPMSVCIPLDGEEPWACVASTEHGARAPGGAWQPWPPKAPAPPQSRLLRVVVDDEDPGTALVSSVAANFVVPPVLPAPVVEYRTQERTLRLHVPGYRADQVEIRYTTDGSVPASNTGRLYEGAVLLDETAGKATGPFTSTGKEEVVVHVRAVAFPKLYFASQVAEAYVKVSPSVSLLTPASAAPQLQEDEQLGSMPHVQLGSPMRMQRTPKRSSSPAHQQCQHQYRFLDSPRSPPSGRALPRHSPTSPQSARPSCLRRNSPPSNHAADRHFMDRNDRTAVASNAFTMRSAELRHAFHAGLYTPPRHPFSQGEGYTSPPLSQRRDSQR